METNASNRKAMLLLTAVMGIYFVLIITVMIFHEPWFDEAQSWLIARDASFSDMLFSIPHYEGHPPLWWLILSVPAKLGMPYEFSLKAVQSLFAFLGVYLMLFHSPFPLWFRSSFPFSYFLFYQYGVIARPYSLMFCAICLCAITWKNRNERPFRFVLSLMLLCLTSAYGILIAGGIALAWTIELIKTRILFRKFKRLAALSLLLALAVILIVSIMPRTDTYATNLYLRDNTNTFPQRLFYFVFCLPSEAFVTSYGSDKTLQLFRPSLSSVMVMIVVSIAIWAMMYHITHKRETVLYLVFPYAFISLFGSWKYFSLHHLGILIFIFVFAAWISMSQQKPSRTNLTRAISVLLITGIAVSIYWTAFSSFTDITSHYSSGKQLAAFIKDNHLEQYNWISIWDQDRNDNGVLVYENTHKCHAAVVEANPYLQAPLTEIQAGGTSYMDHIIPSREQMDLEIDELAKRGIDAMVGFPYNGDYVGRLKIRDTKFAIAGIFPYDKVWKCIHNIDDLFVVIREDITGYGGNKK